MHIVHLGDCRDVLASIADSSIDSIVTDPPYELGFMGKSWDSTGIAYDVTVWRHCLRVLKPGGHLIAFGGSRTYHRMAVAIEDAGFEIRDQVQWIYGSGFPKSHNLKDEWQGWGTALKPAHEPAVLARKPFRGSIAGNVTQWGTGGLNIDGTRVGDDAGRWPANVIIDETAGAMIDEQSGERKSGGVNGVRKRLNSNGWGMKPRTITNGRPANSGGASRFFYVAKASKAEREAGLDIADGRANHHPTVKPIALMRYLVRMVTPKGGVVLDPFTGSGSTGCAAVLEGCDFVGMDITPEYVEIAQKRIAYYAVESPLFATS